MTEEDQKTDDEQTAAAKANETQTEKDDVSTDKDAAAQGDGLDELLKEFDERKAQTTPKGRPDQDEQTDTSELDVTALATLEKQIADMQRREQRRELEGLFEDLRSGVQADAIEAEAYLNALALRDPRLNDLYVNRASHKKQWDTAWGQIKKDFQKYHGKTVDKQATEGRDAVASAVRSASTAAPQTDVTAKEVERMSKTDFDELQRKHGVTPV